MGEKKLTETKFSLDEFQTLWSNEEYIICIYKITESCDIVIDKANEAYLALFCLKESDFEKDINSILPHQTIHNITNSVEVFYGKRGSLSAKKREFEEIYGRSYWHVTHNLSNNRIFCMGKKVYDLRILPKKNSFDLSYPSILATLTNDNRYKVESFSGEFLEKAVHSWMYSGYLDEYPFSEFNIKTTRVVDECIRLNQSIEFLDIVKIPGEQYFVLITLIPIIHIDSTKVLIIVKKSDNPTSINVKDKLEEFSNELIQYFNSKFVGICFLELASNKTFDNVLSNDCFDGLCKKEKQMEETIIKSHEFKQCIRMRSAIRGYIKTKESREISAKYFVQMVPIIVDNIVNGVLLTIDPQYEVSRQGNDLLTEINEARKRNIILCRRWIYKQVHIHKIKYNRGYCKTNHL